MDPIAFAEKRIDWLGHATFRIKGDKVDLYIDPWKLKSNIPADVVCITHSHFDHLSVEDVEKVRKPSTVIVGPPDCRATFGDAFKEISPFGRVTVGDVTIEAVPAYNLTKEFHPKKNNWVGFIVTLDGMRIYHAGDTDLIPEMEQVEADIFLVPVGGTYTMTVNEAADACAKVKPKVAVPMHCGDIVGTLDDRHRFKELCSAAVIILEPTA
jgi:L-ascorbate metabolism protein UlaG (beta-lactamase superfamily)